MVIAISTHQWALNFNLYKNKTLVLTYCSYVSSKKSTLHYALQIHDWCLTILSAERSSLYTWCWLSFQDHLDYLVGPALQDNKAFLEARVQQVYLDHMERQVILDSLAVQVEQVLPDLPALLAIPDVQVKCVDALQSTSIDTQLWSEILTCNCAFRLNCRLLSVAVNVGYIPLYDSC